MPNHLTTLIGRISKAFSLITVCLVGAAHAAPLEEIIVTAQKRAQSLQDVPLSMTALTGEKIHAAGMHSFNELTDYVPNLMTSENAVSTNFIMRGVGPGAQPSFEQSVGVYVDGVHLAKGRQIRSGLFDLQQVEVLRGPQGILFGKNTLAGAINVHSKTPTIGDPTGGKVSLAAESDRGRIAEVGISTSLGDTLAVRLAIKDRDSEGYNTNSYTGARDATMPSADETLWRISASWQPSDNLRVIAKHAQSEHQRIGSPAVITTFQQQPHVGQSNAMMYYVIEKFFPELPQLVARGAMDSFRDGVSIGGLALAQSLGRDLDRDDEKPEGTDTDTEDSSLTIDLDLPGGYTLTSVTGVAEYDYEDGIDADFLPVRFIGRSDISNYEQTSQEFRITSPSDGDFSFITGAYWEQQQQKIDRLVVIDGTLGQPPAVMKAILGGRQSFLSLDAATLAALGLPASYLGLPGATSFDQLGRLSYWRQDSEAWAVFFQGRYQLSETLALTAGLRYTEEDKDVYARTQLTIEADLTNPAGSIATPNPNPTAAVIQAGAFNAYDHEFTETRSTDQLMPAATLEWTQSDNNLYYASYSEGFKSGGFNSVDDQKPAFDNDNNPLSNQPGKGFEYYDETAKSFEIGGKHQLLDGSMEVNWALFSSEYKDQQVSTFVGTSFVVANAASSKVDGLELDVRWQVSDNLIAGATVAYLDARYGSYPAAGCTAEQDSALLGIARAEYPGVADPQLTVDSPVKSALGCHAQFDPNSGRQSGQSQDLAGRQLAHAPDYSGSIFADYSLDIGAVQWYFGVDVNFTDGYYMTGDVDAIDYQTGFEKVNLRAGVRNDSWNLGLFGRNISDRQTASGSADLPLGRGSHFNYTARGRVLGVTLSYQF